MSRAVANDQGRVGTFEHVGVSSRRAALTIKEAVGIFRRADRFAREAIEGGPIQATEVPGAGE